MSYISIRYYRNNRREDTQTLIVFWEWSVKVSHWLENGYLPAFPFPINKGQAYKLALSVSVVDSGDSGVNFSRNELRELFSLNKCTACETHDSFKCKSCISGVYARRGENVSCGPAALDLSTWDHYGKSSFHKIADNALRKICTNSNAITFVFQNKVYLLKTYNDPNTIRSPTTRNSLGNTYTNIRISWRDPTVCNSGRWKMILRINKRIEIALLTEILTSPHRR